MNEHNSVMLNNRNGREREDSFPKGILFPISYFEFQLKHLLCLNKPLFLHNRMSSQDLYEILAKHRHENVKGGVVRLRNERFHQNFIAFLLLLLLGPFIRWNDR